MLHAFGRRAGEAVSALRGAFANPLLRRLELAAIGSVTGEGLYALGVAVFAYKSGGATAVGAVFLLQTLVAAAAQPFTAVLGDRFRRERVMLATELARIALIGALAAAALTELPDATLFALAAVTSAVSTAFWPAQAALLPRLVRRPEELTAANVAASTIESGGMFAGPALGAVVLVAAGVEASEGEELVQQIEEVSRRGVDAPQPLARGLGKRVRNPQLHQVDVPDDRRQRRPKVV